LEGTSEMTVFQYLHRVDQDVTLAINSLGNWFTDPVFQFFSAKEVWYPLYAIIAICLIWRLGWKKGLIAIFACALTVVFCDQFGNFVKDSVQRLRPCWDQNMLKGGLRLGEDKGGLYGFYSAHAANAMGFAICSLLFFKLDTRRRYRVYSPVIIIWALLVGISRVFVGKHFFGDVCAGFLVGAVAAMLMYWLSSRLVRKLSL